MSAPKNLEDCYKEELADNWSANDQMSKMVSQLADKASDPKLKERLSKAAEGIKDHTATLEKLLKDCGESEKEHCKGMEGLVTEARAHALEADISDKDVRDASIIAQTQRMTHYALAGYGVVRAFAQRQGLKSDVEVLQDCLDETYGGDRELTRIAETQVNAAAA